MTQSAQCSQLDKDALTRWTSYVVRCHSKFSIKPALRCMLCCARGSSPGCPHPVQATRRLTLRKDKPVALNPRRRCQEGWHRVENYILDDYPPVTKEITGLHWWDTLQGWCLMLLLLLLPPSSPSPPHVLRSTGASEPPLFEFNEMRNTLSRD